MGVEERDESSSLLWGAKVGMVDVERERSRAMEWGVDLSVSGEIFALL